MLIIVAVLAFHMWRNGWTWEDFREWSAEPDVWSLLTKPPSKQPRETVKVSVEALFQEYRENQVTTDLRYKGKNVIVIGTVADIKKGLRDQIYLELQTPNRRMGAHMNMRRSQERNISTLRKGQPIAVKCRAVRMSLGHPTGDYCEVAETEVADPR